MSHRAPTPLLCGPSTRAWVHHASAAIEGSCEVLNNLNVFPVADSDTGHNVHLTLKAAQNTDPDGILADLARAMLLAAHGNAGSIVAQFFRGWVHSCDPDAELTPELFAQGLRNGSRWAGRAVSAPQHGTILTACQAAADAATEAANKPHPDLVTSFQDALTSTLTAVQASQEQLPQARAAQCVDAGAAAWCVVLHAFANVLDQPVAPLPNWPGATLPDPDLAWGSAADQQAEHEVMVTFTADEHTAENLKHDLATWGNSIVVIGQAPTWRLHIHTTRPAELQNHLQSQLTVLDVATHQVEEGQP